MAVCRGLFERSHSSALSTRTAPARCIPLMSPAASKTAVVSFSTSLHATGRRGARAARWWLGEEFIKASTRPGRLCCSPASNTSATVGCWPRQPRPSAWPQGAACWPCQQPTRVPPSRCRPSCSAWPPSASSVARIAATGDDACWRLCLRSGLSPISAQAALGQTRTAPMRPCQAPASRAPGGRRRDLLPCHPQPCRAARSHSGTGHLAPPSAISPPTDPLGESRCQCRA